MSEARCPLVREIEEDIACNGESFRASILRERYEQIRAALEAAEEMAEHADKATDAPGLWMAAKRYRAATRGE